MAFSIYLDPVQGRNTCGFVEIRPIPLAADGTGVSLFLNRDGTAIAKIRHLLGDRYLAFPGTRAPDPWLSIPHCAPLAEIVSLLPLAVPWLAGQQGALLEAIQADPACPPPFRTTAHRRLADLAPSADA